MKKYIIKQFQQIGLWYRRGCHQRLACTTTGKMPVPQFVWRAGKPALRSLCFILLCLTFLFQCTPNEHVHEGEDSHAHTEEGHHEDENRVTLTPVQLASANIAYGRFDTLNTSGFVRANGVLDLPPQNVAAISSPMPGFVKKANYLVGDYVKKGAALAMIEHPDFLIMQEEYMTLATQMDYLKEEWLRQKQLDSANIAAKKRFQEAEAAYRAAVAKEKSLEKQLQYMGLQPEAIRQGNLSSTIYIRAPFAGYITQLNTHNGMFVRPEEELYEMIDMEHMHMELNVFEKDIPKVKVGQEITFNVPSLGEQTYHGEVFLVGKSFDQENKTIRVHGHIDHDENTFIRGLYLEAMIFTGEQKVMALPEEAVVRDEGKYYIFARQDNDAAGHAHLHEEEHHHNGMEAHEHDENGEGHEHPHEEEEHEHPHAEEAHAHDDEHKHPHDNGDSDTQVATSFQKIMVQIGISQNGWIEIKNYAALPSNGQIVVKGAYDLYSEMKKGEGGHHHH